MRGGTKIVNNLLMALLITAAVLVVPLLAQAAPDSQDAQFAAAPAFPQTETVAAADAGIEIRAIQIIGLSKLTEEQVLPGLTIKAGDILVGNATAKLSDAAESLFNSGWFRTKPVLSLDTYGDTVGSAAVLKVEVQENPLYAGTRVTGNTLVSTERLIQEIEGHPGANGTMEGAKLVKGQVINVKKLVNGLDGMLKLYQEMGYVAAGVQDYKYSLSGPDEGIVDIKLSEGLVEEVIISGLKKTQERVVRSQITHVREGSVLTSNALQRDMEQIYNTGLFDTVEPSLQASLKEGYAKVVFDVTEATTGQAGVGLGYSTVNGIQGSLNYNERNLFNSGKTLGTSLIFSRNKPGFEINYGDPYFTNRGFWNVGVFSLHNRQQRYPGSAYESEIDVDTKGASFGYGMHLNDYDSWLANFSVTDYDYRIVKGDPFIDYSPSQRARLSAEGQTNKLGMSFTRDTRDNVFDTHQGYMGKMIGEFAGFGGDFNFNKWTAEGREFFKVGPGSLGFRQRLGWATGDVPIYEEYRLGGVNSIRGVNEDLLTGTHSMLSNMEYRVPINDMFGAVAFMDYGAAGESFSGMDSALGAGVGARVRIRALGLGAVRLDYGWKLQGDDEEDHQFHFWLGEMF
jgi:outer membrane protein insertion porin family